MSWIDWLEQHELSCPSRAFFGMDCPGCGMQRSIILLLRGDLWESICQYPALLPMFATFVVLGIHLKYKLANGPRLLIILYSLSVLIVIVNFIVRQLMLFHQA